jgi:hypothetical protein
MNAKSEAKGRGRDSKGEQKIVNEIVDKKPFQRYTVIQNPCETDVIFQKGVTGTYIRSASLHTQFKRCYYCPSIFGSLLKDL